MYAIDECEHVRWKRPLSGVASRLVRESNLQRLAMRSTAEASGYTDYSCGQLAWASYRSGMHESRGPKSSLGVRRTLLMSLGVSVNDLVQCDRA